MADGGSSPIIPGTVGVHVLSAKYGESIIVTLPNAKWFVVDAFEEGRAGSTSRPVPAFLERFGLRFSDCLFVLLTHMHHDHYSGIDGLVTAAKVDFQAHYIYAMEGVADRFFAHLEAKRLRERGDHAPRDGSAPFTVGGSRALHAIRRLCRGEGCTQVAQWKILAQSRLTGDCDLLGATPTTDFPEHYLEEAIACDHKISAALQQGLDASTLRRHHAEAVNNAGVAVYVGFGETRVLLGADCESAVWTALASRPAPSASNCDVGSVLSRNVMLKVPHHGSRGAWCQVLADSFREGATRWAIATHCHLAGNKLPTRSGLDAILADGVKLLVPNRDFLDTASRSLVRAHPNYQCIPVWDGVRPSTADLRRLDKRRDKDDKPQRFGPGKLEIHWASLSFDNNGASMRPFGGTKLAILG